MLLLVVCISLPPHRFSIISAPKRRRACSFCVALGEKQLNTVFLPVLQIICRLIGLPVLSINLLIFVEFLFITSARYIHLALVRLPFPTFRFVCWLIALLGGCLGTAREKNPKRASPASPDPSARAPELHSVSALRQSTFCGFFLFAICTVL